jgi:LPXTG-motif cell wall-anchored protein
MITRQPRAWPGLLLAGLLSLLSPSVPAFAQASGSGGPVYTSAAQVEVAQRVLRYENLLRPGRYTAGRMDYATVDALRAFQRRHAIPDNGVLDQETMAQLMSHVSAMQMAQARSASASERAAGQAQESTRTMPETASQIPLMTGLGVLLLGGGLLLLRRGKA